MSRHWALRSFWFNDPFGIQILEGFSKSFSGGAVGPWKHFGGPLGGTQSLGDARVVGLVCIDGPERLERIAYTQKYRLLDPLANPIEKTIAVHGTSHPRCLRENLCGRRSGS